MPEEQSFVTDRVVEALTEYMQHQAAYKEQRDRHSLPFDVAEVQALKGVRRSKEKLKKALEECIDSRVNQILKQRGVE